MCGMNVLKERKCSILIFLRDGTEFRTRMEGARVARGCGKKSMSVIRGKLGIGRQILTRGGRDHHTRRMGDVCATPRLPPHCESFVSPMLRWRDEDEGGKTRRRRGEDGSKNLHSASLPAIAASACARLRFSASTFSFLRRVASSSRALSSSLAREPN